MNTHNFDWGSFAQFLLVLLLFFIVGYALWHTPLYPMRVGV